MRSPNGIILTYTEVAREMVEGRSMGLTLKNQKCLARELADLPGGGRSEVGGIASEVLVPRMCMVDVNEPGLWEVRDTGEHEDLEDRYMIFGEMAS